MVDKLRFANREGVRFVYVVQSKGMAGRDRQPGGWTGPVFHLVHAGSPSVLPD